MGLPNYENSICSQCERPITGTSLTQLVQEAHNVSVCHSCAMAFDDEFPRCDDCGSHFEQNDETKGSVKYTDRCLCQKCLDRWEMNAWYYAQG